MEMNANLFRFVFDIICFSRNNPNHPYKERKKVFIWIFMRNTFESKIKIKHSNQTFLSNAFYLKVRNSFFTFLLMNDNLHVIRFVNWKINSFSLNSLPFTNFFPFILSQFRFFPLRSYSFSFYCSLKSLW